ncbi:PLDc N-terminal domain-containing protein [Sphingobacterium sp. 1.A.5]|uniref:PLDc N-terminal domain-containing protein n=1 Tax=Sphingobacterium sp. 1.A.5 TaxID=2044604 RepID=UPI000C0BC745|nr:PLDc N-terminal domain-containing protein [Sphingobacterium sp. 1.A.5]
MNLLFINIGGLEFIVLLIASIFYLYSFYKVIVDKYLSTNERLMWIIVILIFNLIGAIAYWIWGNNKKRVGSSRF